MWKRTRAGGRAAGSGGCVSPFALSITNAASSVQRTRLGRILPIRSPYATTVWDYINRGMALGDEGTLTADEVYALTAYLLYINDVIAEDAVMDAESLPMVEMPNRDNWAPLPDWKPGMPRLPGYPH